MIGKPVKLAKGRNLLLIRLENLRYYAYLRVRLSTPDGGVLDGVTPSTSKKTPKRR